jgi:hypothetical protein
MNTMPAKIYILLAAAPLASPSYSQSTLANDALIIGDSDTEVKTIKTRMKDIRSVLTALPRTVTAPGLGAQIYEAHKAFEAANLNFKASNWKAAINEARRFFDLTQKPDHKTWLKAQYILGRSLEETGQSKNATKIYLNYLATLATSSEQKPQELTDVFGRLVRVATKNSQTSQNDLSKFLSSLVAANRPAEISDQMKYLSGVASSNIGQRGLALSWLEEAESEAASPDTKARSKYFKALMAIHSKNWRQASEQLDSVVKIADLNISLKDMAHLALARVQIKLQKPGLALKNYDSIGEASDFYREANLEKIFLLIQQSRNDDALKTSQQWLSKYSKHPDALQIKSLISWLELKTGNLDAAKSSIEKTQQLLTGIRTELKNSFDNQKLTKEDAERLKNLTEGHIPTVQDLHDIRVAFSQLDDLGERLAELDGVERGLIFALARSDIGQFKPALANQLNQYDSLADETLQAGAKLVYIDRIRLEQKLSDIDKQKLRANENRRATLFGKYERLKRHLQRWLAWAPPAEQLAKLAKDWERLDLIAGKSLATGVISENDPDVANIQVRINAARQDMLQTLRSLQAVRAENIIEQSELTDSLAIFDAYKALITEDMVILSSYLPSNVSTSEKLDDDDARSARTEWEYTASALKLNMTELKTRAQNDIVAILTGLERSDQAKSQLTVDIAQLRAMLESYAGQRLPSIISQFDYAIAQRLGKQLKWSGDLEYLKYADSTNAQDSERRKNELEKQILSDEIRDYGQRRPK